MVFLLVLAAFPHESVVACIFGVSWWISWGLPVPVASLKCLEADWLLPRASWFSSSGLLSYGLQQVSAALQSAESSTFPLQQESKSQCTGTFQVTCLLMLYLEGMKSNSNSK